MIPTKLNIQVFNVLDSIAEAYGHNDYDWALHAFGSRQYQSRISEIRNKNKKEGTTGRAFSYSKCVSLVIGLQKLIGRDVLEKELKQRLDKIDSAKERMILMVLALPEKKEKTTEIYLREVLDEE